MPWIDDWGKWRVWVLIFLSSCDGIIMFGGQTTSPARELIQIAQCLAIWLFPAGLLFFWIGTDSDETTTHYGSDSEGNTVTVYIPTGRVIPGNPKLAILSANIWLFLSPIGVVYYALLSYLNLSMTGFPNIDWILLKIVFPLLFAVVTIRLIKRISALSLPVGGMLRSFWYALIILSAIHVLGWLLTIAVPIVLQIILALFQLIGEVFSWLLKK
jgi:hypothetical protein